MKLGEALSKRALQAQQLNHLHRRMVANATVQEGDAPAEDPNRLLQEYIHLSEQHADLVTGINRTNTESGQLALLSERDHKIRRRNAIRSLASAASDRHLMRFGRQEIKYVPTVDVAKLEREADLLTEDIRDLDAKIQENNWQIDLK